SLPRHADNLTFLWAMRRSTTDARYADLGIISQVDERIDFHLAALRAAGDAGWKACGQPDAWKSADAFAAALLAFSAGSKEWITTVTDTIAAADIGEGVAAALGWLPYGDIRQHVRALLQAESPAVRRVGLGACCLQREDPGQALDDALKDVDPALRARALRGV